MAQSISAPYQSFFCIANADICYATRERAEMFKDTRAKWVAIGTIAAVFTCGSSASFGQDSPSGFRSTLNRFFGAQPRQSEDIPDVEMPEEPEAEREQAPAEETQKPARTSGPTSPRGRSSNFRPASTGQSGGLFGGGLFHQLRSVTKSEESSPPSEDDSAPEAGATQAPAAKPTAPAIEPFSKPAVPPPSSSTNVIPKSNPTSPSASKSYSLCRAIVMMVQAACQISLLQVVVTCRRLFDLMSICNVRCRKLHPVAMLQRRILQR